MFEDEFGEWHNIFYVITWILKIVRLVDAAWSPSDILIASKAMPTRLEAIESLDAVAH